MPDVTSTRAHARSIAPADNSMTSLFYRTVTAATGGSPTRWMLVLHGILGSGDNWRTQMHRFVRDRPTWGAVLVDLRMHGRSQDRLPPHTVETAAADLQAVIDELAEPVSAILGHSFGGKVALSHAAAHPSDLEHVWDLDAMPGPRPDAHGSEATLEAITMLENMPFPIPSQQVFTEQAQQHGLSRGVALWLAKNLTRRDDGQLELGIDTQAIRALVDDHLHRDLWHVVEEPPRGPTFHLVAGGDSGAFDATARQRARAAADASPRVEFHELEGAGHWVHVDAPDALQALMKRFM